MPKTPRPRIRAIRKARHAARDARAAAGIDPVATKAAATAVARAAKTRKQARKRRARSAELTAWLDGRAKRPTAPGGTARPAPATEGSTETNPALEAAIRTDPTSAGAVAVYADWLQEHGNPAGALMIAAQALAHRSARWAVNPDLELVQLERAAGLPDSGMEVVWRAGIWQALHVAEAGLGDDGEDSALLRAIDALYGSPFACALATLRIAALGEELVPRIIACAEGRGWSRMLARLELGAVDAAGAAMPRSGAVGRVGRAISEMFPNLASLAIAAGDVEWRQSPSFELAGLALPALASLTIETATLSRTHVQDLIAARLPRLTHLELWFGDTDRASARVEDLAPILARDAHPNLVALGLRNTELSDLFAGALATAPIAARLVALDLSLGTLSAAGAAALIAARAAFAALRTLNVDDNCLTNDAIVRLRAAFTGVDIVERRQKVERRVTVPE